MAKQTQQDKRKNELIDKLLKDYDGTDSFWGSSGLFADLKKRISQATETVIDKVRAWHGSPCS